MKLFTTKQSAEIDQYTIKNEPISHIDLMERAAGKIVEWLVTYCDRNKVFYCFAGPGNNGGDVLAVARMLAERGYRCFVFLAGHFEQLKGSPAINYKRLVNQGLVPTVDFENCKVLPSLKEKDIILDGLFGSGLNRPLNGFMAELVQWMNHSQAKIIAIDIPSGLMGQDNSMNDSDSIVRASLTLTLEYPKLSFLFHENSIFVGEWIVLPIDLDSDIKRNLSSNYYLITEEVIRSLIKKRPKYSHKGTFGHALLVSGSYGKMGACILAAKGCLRSGVGLLSVHIPHNGYQIIQVAVPEAMCSIDASDYMFTECECVEKYSAIGIGPGIGKKPNTQKGLQMLLQQEVARLVLDADALNIMSEHSDWWDMVPAGTIITPHPKEFERIAGKSVDSWERLGKQVDFSKRYKVIVVLKGAHTSVSFPDGKVWFNSTGNPGMATGGSGDVLTGIITGLLAQRYSPEEAALIGVFIHGMAGDLAAFENGESALIAGDLTNFLGKAFLKFENHR